MSDKRYLASFLVSALVVASCARELDAPMGSQGTSEVTIGVSLPDASVKTALGPRGENTYQTVWCEGDRLSLNGVASEPLSVEAAGENKAVFRFKGSITWPYNILYPAVSEAAQVRWPSVQQYRNGTFDPEATPMYSSTRTFEAAALSHLGSILRFSFTSAENVKLSQIQVTSMGGEHLSGDFSMLTDAEGFFTGEMTAGEGSVSTILSFGEDGFTLGREPSEFFISIPHGTYSRGFTALAITSDDRAMELKFYTKDGEHTVPASKVIEFETVEFAADESMLLIKTVSDLRALETSQSAYTTAVIIDDLDLTGEEWTPLTDISLTLSGAGHNIKGLSGALCKTLSGTIKDLTVEASITSTGLHAASFAEVMDGENALLDNCMAIGSVTMANQSPTSTLYVAGLVGQLVSGTISGCVNRAEISASSAIPANSATDLIMGGLVADAASGAVVSSSRNEGTVRSEAPSMRYQYIGGCLAESEADLSGIANSGDVIVGNTVQPTARLYVGGAVGYLKSGSLSGVTAASDVTVGGFTAAKNANVVGGVIGYNAIASIDGTMVSNLPEASINYTVTNGAANPMVGGLIGYNVSNNAVLDGLVNNAAVNVTFPAGHQATTDMKIGGVTGYLYFSAGKSDATITCRNCINNGDISLSGKVFSTSGAYNAGVQIGGVLGRFQITQGNVVKGYVAGCENKGDIVMHGCEGSTYVFLGGCMGTFSVEDIEISDCKNSGNITMDGGSDGLCSLGGICGNVYRAAVCAASFRNCSNSGSLTADNGSYTTEADERRLAAGGIIGNAHSDKSDRHLTLDITDCTNSGTITRNTTVYDKESLLFGGGIIGSIGRHTSLKDASKEDYVTVTVEGCSNSAQIIFNQFFGFGASDVEKSTNVSFSGGIVGVSQAANGSTDIICCSNSGNILGTSGQHGGIIGFMRAGTKVRGVRTAEGVNYCVNTGNVCDYDPSAVTLTGTGYCYAGGIAGYLKSDTVNSIEYCWNSGNVCGSNSNAQLPFTGGIVGQNQRDNAVRYCKNSGNIRNQKAGYCGAISGADISNGSFGSCRVQYCGVGGRVYRSTGWITMDEGTTYPWQDYIYSYTRLTGDDLAPSASYPEGIYYKGCCWWDGSSVLSWEKSGWVEPAE